MSDPVPDGGVVNLGFARIDSDRRTRCGRPEVIFGQGKTAEEIARIASVIHEREGHVLATRVSEDQASVIHRLLAETERIRSCSVLVVVAGMEGALPSAVAGLVDLPVIAVPTSIGYGAHFQGLTALLGMVNSCASGVTVVNIDNGFGAAFAADSILRLVEKTHSSTR